MAVGGSVKNGALWDTRRPPRGNSALQNMGALFGGPYITPSTCGIRIDTTEEKLEHKQNSFVGTPVRVLKRAPVRGNSGAWRLCKGKVRLPLLGRNTCRLEV